MAACTFLYKPQFYSKRRFPFDWEKSMEMFSHWTGTHTHTHTILGYVLLLLLDAVIESASEVVIRIMITVIFYPLHSVSRSIARPCVYYQIIERTALLLLSFFFFVALARERISRKIWTKLLQSSTATVHCLYGIFCCSHNFFFFFSSSRFGEASITMHTRELGWA